MKVMITLLGQLVLEGRKNNNIKTLINMCSMRRIAHYNNLIFFGMLQKFGCIM